MEEELHQKLGQIYSQRISCFEIFLQRCLDECKDSQTQVDLCHKFINEKEKAICCALNAHAIMITRKAVRAQNAAKNMDEYAEFYKRTILNEYEKTLQFINSLIKGEKYE